MLRAAEIRNDLVPRPGAAARILRPPIVIAAQSAAIHQAVDTAASAQHSPGSISEATAANCGVRFGLETPVCFRVTEQPHRHGGGIAYDGVAAGPCLEQQHANASIGGQAIGKDAAGAAGADDDKVVLAHP